MGANGGIVGGIESRPTNCGSLMVKNLTAESAEFAEILYSCFLCALRVSAVKSSGTLFERTHHGDTEMTEKTH
jgi:hypothetical protein